MPLFGSGRDANFVRSINRELINKVIDNEVAVYKISREDTTSNIYGESPDKFYYQPVRVRALIDRQNRENTNENSVIDTERQISFGFIKDDLKDLGLLIEVGDIIEWNEEYFEVDISRGSQYWGLMNPSTLKGNVEKEHSIFGYGVSVIAECHLTKQSRIQIVNSRLDVKDTPINRAKSIYD